MSALIELMKFASPPSRSPFRFDWLEVEKELGTKLPDDYKELTNVYGCGVFGDYINLLAPIGMNQITKLGHSLVDRFFFEDSIFLEELAEKYAFFREKPLPLLAWAATSVEDLIFYLTTDKNPNDWKIFTCDSMDYAFFEGTAAEYILGMFTGKTHNFFFESYFVEGVSPHNDAFVPTP